MKVFAMISSPGPNWREGKTVYEQDLLEHARYQEELLKAGKLVMAGPFSDGSGGMTLLRAESEEEARELMENDPGIREGIFQSVIRPWHIVFDDTPPR